MLKGKYHGNLMLYQKLPKVLLKFVEDCHTSVLRLLMSVSGHRLTGLEWTATLKTLGCLTIFKFSHFCFQNALEQVMSCSSEEFSQFLFLDLQE